MVVAIMPGMAIGERIRELRKAKKMTQEQLARAANMGTSHLARLEQGVIADPSWTTAVAIARALGVPINQLQDDCADASPQKRGRAKKGGDA